MGYTEDVNQASQFRDDIVARNTATQALLSLVTKYGGSSVLAQAVIDADTQVQSLMLTAIGAVLAASKATPIAMPANLAPATVAP